jgi:hypothetical protein
MMLLPDPNALRRPGRELRGTAERARRLRAARRRGREVSIRDLLPPRDVVPLPRPRTREERYGTELERCA